MNNPQYFISLIAIVTSMQLYEIASHNFPMFRTNNNNAQIIGNSFDDYYYFNISIGTPPQSFNVQIDTGSNVFSLQNNQLLWVTNATCPYCPITTTFNPYLSSTYENLSIIESIAYGQGECSGWESIDYVQLEGTPINTTFEFMVATQEQNFYYNNGTTGIMGLSNDQTNMNIFQAAYNFNQLSTPLYGFLFNHTENQSYLLYNQWNSTFTDQIIWIDTNMDNRWSLLLIGLEINGQYQEITQQDALFDSGTTCVQVQNQTYQQILTYFNAEVCFQNNNNCLCSHPSYPNITFYYQGAKIVITQLQYMVPNGNGYCFPCFGSSQPWNILGDPFLQTFISIYDKDQQKIGFYGVTPVNQINQVLIPFILFCQICLCMFTLFYTSQMFDKSV